MKTSRDRGRVDVKRNEYTSRGTSQSNRPPPPPPPPVFKTARQGIYEINSVYAREQDESEALSSLVWALEACKGMMQSRSGAVHLKATIHHCRTRQGRNSLIHRYTLFLPCALRSLSLSLFLRPFRSISSSLPLTPHHFSLHPILLSHSPHHIDIHIRSLLVSFLPSVLSSSPSHLLEERHERSRGHNFSAPST